MRVVDVPIGHAILSWGEEKENKKMVRARTPGTAPLLFAAVALICNADTQT